MIVGPQIIENTLMVGVGALTTTAICWNGYSIGERLGVLAEPDACRKLHARPTPQVGGIAILTGLMAWAAVMLFIDPTLDHHLVYSVAVSAVGVGVVGFADDQTGLSPGVRILLLLVFLGMAFVIDTEMVAPRLSWGSFEPTTIPLWIYVPLMALTSGGVVNSVNMADGQDGVVGSMFVVWSGCLLFITGGTAAAVAAVIFVLSLIFLVFNIRGKLFLGDCGSYGVTFVLGLLVALAHARGQLSLETIIVWFFVPVADCLRLLVTRMARGQSPFLGDRDHLHHRLEDKMGKQKGLASYAVAVAVSSLAATLEPKFALVCLALLCAFYFSFAGLTDSQVKRQATPRHTDKSADNVVSIPVERTASKKRKGAG